MNSRIFYRIYQCCVSAGVWSARPYPYGANTPDHAIAARGDLDAKNPDPNGAVDAKVNRLAVIVR